ncbi:MAG: hypothetical protein JWM56_1258 [Candidatus Peribacteria bacterium]|nr:hypothetical protein [Candidatus Peribacteria bacterium]
MSNLDKISQQLIPEGFDIEDGENKRLLNEGTLNAFNFMMHEGLPVTDLKVVSYIQSLRESIATLSSQPPSEFTGAEQTSNYRTINISFAGDYPMDFTLAKDIRWGLHLLKTGTKLSFRSAGGPECYYTFEATSPDGKIFTIYEPERNLPKDIPILEE